MLLIKLTSLKEETNNSDHIHQDMKDNMKLISLMHVRMFEIGSQIVKIA